MTTKEKVIHESIQRATAERAGLMELINRNPYSELMALDEETLAECKRLNSENRTTDALEVLKQYNIKRNELLDFAKRQQNSTAHIERIVALESELRDLSMKQALMDIRRNVRQ